MLKYTFYVDKRVCVRLFYINHQFYQLKIKYCKRVIFKKKGGQANRKEMKLYITVLDSSNQHQNFGGKLKKLGWGCVNQS